jgi:hypothetical protein
MNAIIPASEVPAIKLPATFATRTMTLSTMEKIQGSQIVIDLGLSIHDDSESVAWDRNPRIRRSDGLFVATE